MKAEVREDFLNKVGLQLVLEGQEEFELVELEGKNILSGIGVVGKHVYPPKLGSGIN